MIERRTFVAMVAGGLLASPLPSEAQQADRCIGSVPLARLRPFLLQRVPVRSALTTAGFWIIIHYHE
jgi:hypothetical protein